MPVIMLEGCDCAGKSTFGDLLHELWGRRGNENTIMRMHRGQPRDTWWNEYERALYETHWSPETAFTGVDCVNLKSHQLVVLDRWHLGELIYGPLYRGKSNLTPAAELHVDMVLRKLGVVQVHVTADVADVERRHKDRGEEFLQIGDVADVMAKYQELSVRYRMLQVNTSFDIEYTRTQALNMLDYADLHMEPKRVALAPFPTYVGPIKPTVLLLGEHGNRLPDGRNGPPAYRPAFTPSVKGSSSEYICKAFKETGAPPGFFGMANALEERDRIGDLWETLGKPYVVTLGAAARATWRVRTNQRAGYVHHPQWARRFCAGREREYGMTLVTAAADQRDVLMTRNGA